MDETSSTTEQAVFAGGCFWCMEAPFEQVEGVLSVRSGYAGGHDEDPTYEEVSAGATGHLEVVEVRYDPARVSYEELLEIYWRQVDPTDGGGQFVDRGKQYRTAIFSADEEQRRLAEESKRALAASGRYEQGIVTEILPLERFYPAEEYRQDYYKEHPLKYAYYRGGSGRDAYLDEVWGAEAHGKDAYRILAAEPDGELRARLTPLQYEVTQEEGTEPPFENEYWNESREGIYVDIVSGEPLFSSRDKYESGTGWPSFTHPLEPENIVTREDHKLFTTRTEVRSKGADSHLGHLFEDGPEEEGGLRYCMNSAALRFIPKEELEKEGYGEYRALFEETG